MAEIQRITFIGSGAMGEAMIKGMVAQEVVQAAQIMASDPVAARREQMKSQFGVSTTDSNRIAVQDADVVVLSVKPQILPKVLADLKGHLPSEALILSIVAGVPIATIQKGLAHDRIVRTMPNTPAQVGKGMTVWVATPAVTSQQRQQTQAILNALGEQVMVEDEHYLDMATGLSGSGPGYVFLLIEAMIDAGVHIGFSRADAQKIVLQTIDGSVELVRSTGLHPAELKNRVTSPAGTTAAGLFELEQSGVRAAILRAVEAAYRRSEALGAQYSQKGDEMIVIELLNVILGLYSWVLIARALISWIPNIDPYHPAVQFLYSVTEPVLEPIRKLVPPLGGMIDISMIVAFIAIWFLQMLLSSVA